MLGYYLRLATNSLKRNRVLTALMIAAIALGIGMSMTSLTVLHMMSGNPLAHKDDLVRRVQVDNWDAEQSFDDERPERLPYLMTYRDATNLLAAKQAKHFSTSFPNVLAVEPAKREIKPYMLTVLFATHGFFPIFEPPFRFGGGWSEREDRDAARVVVLGHASNEKLFGGVNSVGRRVRLGGEDYTVSGVLHDWQPIPRVYGIDGGAFSEPEDAFVPFAIGIEKEFTSAANNSCYEDPGIGYKAWLDSECIWLNVFVEAENSAQVGQYRSFLDSYVQEQKRSGRFPRPLRTGVPSISEWLDTERVVGRDARTQVWLAFAFFAVCLINTVGLLLAKFMGKASEIGLRRAVGASKPAVFAQYLTESGLVGLVGGVGGLALTGLGLLALRRLYADTPTERLAQMDWTMVALSLLIALIASLLAGLYPTWRACQVQPATQLKTQ